MKERKRWSSVLWCIPDSDIYCLLMSNNYNHLTQMSNINYHYLATLLCFSVKLIPCICLDLTLLYPSDRTKIQYKNIVLAFRLLQFQLSTV